MNSYYLPFIKICIYLLLQIKLLFFTYNTYNLYTFLPKTIVSDLCENEGLDLRKNKTNQQHSDSRHDLFRQIPTIYWLQIFS